MTIEQIAYEINQIENLLYFDSLYGIDNEGLLELHEKVKSVKEDFLQLPFTGLMIEELEDIRFRLLEAGINIDISIKEKRHEDVEDEIRQLEELYRIAQTYQN